MAQQESRLRERRGRDRERAAGAGPGHGLVFTEKPQVHRVGRIGMLWDVEEGTPFLSTGCRPCLRRWC